jgi:xanthine dehydrogenase/oxidase
MSRDIPVDFRVKMIENKPNPVGILGSKSAGEPPLVLCSSVWMALKHAIASAREDRGVQGYFQLDLPATVDEIQKASLVEPLEFKLTT